MEVTTPIKAAVRAVPPASLARFEDFPGIQYDDNTITFVVEDLREAYDGLQAVIGMATLGYRSVLNERLREIPNIREIIDDYNAALFDRWMDFESGPDLNHVAESEHAATHRLAVETSAVAAAEILHFHDRALDDDAGVMP